MYIGNKPYITNIRYCAPRIIIDFLPGELFFRRTTFMFSVEMSATDDKNNCVDTPLKCDQFVDSLKSFSNNENPIVCETENIFPKTPKTNFGNNTGSQTRMENPFIFPKKLGVSLKFDDITFSTNEWNWSSKQFPNFRQKKEILHGVSGEFKSGELSVIMGPSGAGKSTLLNVLAGFKTRGSTGTVKLNGTIRDRSPRYRKLSAYITQEDELRLALTVKEAMTFAAHLKLGYNVTNDFKMQKINGILQLLGLDECYNTLTSRLSGGQRKRLAVALELINNPPIIFLDEPTTGLDSSSCTQCISLFKKLAQEGRTVIATIHQPSALLFEMFDKLYALSLGRCIYDNKPNYLVEHLASMNLHCPSHHNPADYLIEVAVGEHEADINLMSEKAKALQSHQSIVSYKEQEMLSQRPIFAEDIYPSPDDQCSPAAVIMQFLLLYKRNLITTKRTYSWVLNRLLAHILIGFLFGYLYKDVGKTANTILANYVYLYGTLLLTVYTGKMPVTLCFPMEMRILLREHFNRWYKLSPYLLSVVLIEIPFQAICVWSYVGISYWLTNQPFDFRLFLFVVFVTACSLCAQSMGYFIGATTNIKVAVFVGPVLACFLSVFGFCIRSYDTPFYFKVIFYLSYFRAAFQSIVYSIYGFGRSKLSCPDDTAYCHYQDPKKFLNEMDIVDIDLVSNISLIVFFWCLMLAATYLTLWIKLNRR